MRNKVFIIKGVGGLAEKLTLAAFERIRVSHVVAITALKYPQFVPFHLEIGSIEPQMSNILRHWEDIEQTHLVTSEYVNAIMDRGGADNVKAVESFPSGFDWLYESVRSLHRNLNQVVIDLILERDSWCENTWRIKYEDRVLTLDETGELFGPAHGLG